MPSLTITVGSSDANRIVTAFRETLSLPNEDQLTDLEFVRQALLRDVRDKVRDYERQQAIADLISQPVVDPDVS